MKYSFVPKAVFTFDYKIFKDLIYSVQFLYISTEDVGVVEKSNFFFFSTKYDRIAQVL